MTKLQKLQKHIEERSNDNTLNVKQSIILSATLDALTEQVEDSMFIGGLVEVELAEHIDFLVEELKKVKAILVGEKDFLKTDLKLGDLVETTSGGQYILGKTGENLRAFIGVGANQGDIMELFKFDKNLRFYRDFLEERSDNPFTIYKVYRLNLVTKTYKNIWERVGE